MEDSKIEKLSSSKFIIFHIFTIIICEIQMNTQKKEIAYKKLEIALKILEISHKK